MSEAQVPEDRSPKAVIRNYLLENEPVFARLYNLQQEGWKRESGDTYFQKRRARADTANEKAQRILYEMMKEIGIEMNNVTGALTLGQDSDSNIQVLDLCMAPGGFSAAVLDLNPTASIHAISLPQQEGGHRVLLHLAPRDSRLRILFTDITMLAAEYGVDLVNIPCDHPDVAKFKPLRAYEGKQYNLVLCDGQVLRTQKRETYRERHEATRLTNAQLILGLQRIKPGGTLIILLHKLESWDTMMLVREFAAFATIDLFKPVKAHAIRSSFYMIAKDVQPQSMEARLALKRYRELWHRATFGNGGEFGEDEVTEDVATVLEEFGPRLVELGREVWRLQADALEKAPFMQNKRIGEGASKDNVG